MYDKLFPFQKTAVDKMLTFLLNSPTHSCYNACVPGLGKTIQTIAALKMLPKSRTQSPIDLIICPSVMKHTWRKELQTWFPESAVTIINTSSDLKILSSLTAPTNSNTQTAAANIVIISYDLASRNIEKFKKLSIRTLVLDEAHYLKSYKAKRTKNILKVIWENSIYRIALSGTPFTRSVIDGYTLFSKMSPQHFPDFLSFATTYCYEKRTPWSIEYYGVKNVEQLRGIIRSNFYIRYTKEEVIKDLPPKKYQKIVLPKDYSVWTYDEESLIQEAFKNIIEKGSVPDITSIAGLRRAQALKKLPAIVEFVKDLLEQEIPVVLFGYHKQVVEELIKEFSEYNPLTITAETSSAERSRVVDEFQNNEERLLFIGSMVASGIGITLTKSSTVVLAELDWSPSVIDQAVCRCHRIGTINPVTAYYFVVDNSIEETIADVVVEKASTFAEVLEND